MISCTDDSRTEIERKILESGGNYQPNLTKEEHILIASEPVGLKFEFAQRFSIKTVGIEWLDQCIERGMVLEDRYFHPLIPPEKRGTNAWVRKHTLATSLGKHGRDEVEAGRSKKLRRTASAKLDTVTSGIWAEISQPKERTEWESGKTKNVPVATDAESPVLNAPLPQRGTNAQDFTNETGQSKGLFHGKTFTLHGFSSQKAAKVEHFLSSRGARFMQYANVASEADRTTLNDIILMVPHELAEPLLPDLAKQIPPENIVTEFWAERCMLSKRYEDPQAHAINRPFRRIPVQGCDKLKVTSTGFQGFERNHAAKAVVALGGRYEQNFDATFSLLVCDPKLASVEKLAHAHLWRVPAVNPKWLWDCVRNGELMDFGPYLVQPTRQQEGDAEEDESRQGKDRPPKPQDSSTQGASSRRVPGVTEPSKSRATTEKGSNKTSKEPKSRKPDPFPDESGPQMDDEPQDTAPNDKPSKQPPERPSSIQPPSSSAVQNRSSLPLQEITPNSSPPKPSFKPDDEATVLESFTKPASPAAPKAPSQSDILNADIHSLLLQRKASNSRPVDHKSQPPQRGRRRHRRPLLGRAPSNISTHSRASSVDTLNTDGIGTPILSACSTNAPPLSLSNRNSSSNVVYDADQAEEEEKRQHAEQMALTQVGYDDPGADFYRAQVEKNLKGKGKITYGKGGTPRRGAVGWGSGNRNGAGTAGVVQGKGSAQTEELGIAKRTRAAVGR